MNRIILFFVICYSQFILSISHPFRIRIITWNTAQLVPDCTRFQELAFTSLSDGKTPDLLVFGFQEAGKLLSTLLSVSLAESLRLCMEKNNYQQIISDYIGNPTSQPILLCIYVWNSQSQRVKLLNYGIEPTLKVNGHVYGSRFFGGLFVYKGLIAARLQIDGLSQLVFVNMHLPAHEGKSEERCQLWRTFLERHTDRFDYMFAFGDQNWRTLPSLTIDTILKAIKTRDYQKIINNEELTQIRQDQSKNCFSSFYEAPIQFPPTYKFVPNSNRYETAKDNEERRPSYTDRILVSSISSDLKFLKYSSISLIKDSDHRPVFADIIFDKKTKQDLISTKTTTTTTTTTSPLEKSLIIRKNETRIISTQSSKSKSTNLLTLIIIIVVVCTGILLLIYFFLIKPRLEKYDYLQAT